MILNPKSGVGKAREVFQSKVVPLLTEADINYDLHVTRHAQDARNLMRTQVIHILLFAPIYYDKLDHYLLYF